MNQSKKSQYLESHLQSNETTTTDTRSTSLVRCLFYRDKINVGKKSWWQEICLYMSWKVMVRYFSECKLNYYDIPLEQIALRMFGNKENDKDESIDSRINSRTITYWHPSFPFMRKLLKERANVSSYLKVLLSNAAELVLAKLIPFVKYQMV